MVNPLPFTRPPDEDLAVLPEGGFGFLNVLVTQDGDMTPPDVFDYIDAFRIEDPDGNDVTAAWATTMLDPLDPDDVYDENHATYAGDDAAPANTGLFVRGKSVGMPGGDGWAGVKVEVPAGAEQTYLTPDRFYKVFWDIRLNSHGLTDGDGEAFERFNVGPAGFLDFGGSTVTVADVKQIYAVKDLEDDFIKGLIFTATCIIDAFLLMVGCVRPSVLPCSLKSAIMFMTAWLLLDYDQSRGYLTNSVSQGGMSLTFQAIDQRKKSYFDPDMNTGLAMRMLMAFLATKRIYALKTPVVHVFRKTTGEVIPRHVQWFYRDY